MQSRQHFWVDRAILAMKGLFLCWVLGVLYLHNVEGPGRLFWWIVDHFCECVW